MTQDVGPTAQDPDFWKPRRCFREPIPEIFHAAQLLNQAVDAHLAGDTRNAARLIEEANMQEVWDWTASIWGTYKHEIRRVRKVDGMPPKVCKSERDPDRKANSEQKQELISRYGRHCMFCGIPLIRAEIREAIRKDYFEVLPWEGTNKTEHAAFQCMCMQFDHVIAHSRGGRTAFGNLIITCYPCNYGRGESTLEEVGLIDPRTCHETKFAWDGHATWNGLECFTNN